jgi:small ligand-binding sensory domain FIST
MPFCSVISDHVESDVATDDLVDQARAVIGPRADVVFVFLTGDHAEAAEEIAEKLTLELEPTVMIGCSGEGVIGGDREIEREPGIAILAGNLPDGVEAKAFHIGRDDWADVLTDPSTLAGRIGHFDDTRLLVGCGDPFSTPLQQFMPALAKLAPGLPLVGGMASSSRKEGGNRLICNDAVHSEGLVGVTIGGPIEVETIVSQGCRPIGRHMVITKSNKNVIETLGGKAALSAVREMVDQLSEADRKLLQSGLMVGRVIDEYREKFDRGDFLIRNIIGADENTGSIEVADLVRTGQTIQFQVRDNETADEDLTQMLSRPATIGDALAGLLFSCNGRGCRMFGDADHDILAARSALPRTPFAGFFAAGELGPIGNQNFIHGHTASFALLRRKA